MCYPLVLLLFDNAALLLMCLIHPIITSKFVVSDPLKKNFELPFWINCKNIILGCWSIHASKQLS